MDISAPSLPTFADAITALKAECCYYVNGHCDTVACARENGCAVAKVLFALHEQQAALEKCRNYIANTECELGIELDCGVAARAVLTKWEIKP